MTSDIIHGKPVGRVLAVRTTDQPRALRYGSSRCGRQPPTAPCPAAAASRELGVPAARGREGGAAQAADNRAQLALLLDHLPPAAHAAHAHARARS